MKPTGLSVLLLLKKICNRENIFELGKFGVGGALGVLIYVGSFHLMTVVCGLWYITALVIATVLKRVFSFLFQKYITFKNTESERMLRQGFGYISVILLLMGLNTLSMYILVDCLLISQGVALFIPMLPLGLLSFLLTKAIFRKR